MIAWAWWTAVGCAWLRPPLPSSAQVEALLAKEAGAWAVEGEAAEIHGVLQEALAGEALTDRFLEIVAARRRLASQGARVRIDRVGVEGLRAEGEGVLVQWTVDATVQHEDHAHVRRHALEAFVELDDTPEGPRMTAFEARSARRQRSGLAADPFLTGEGLPPGFVDPLEALWGDRP